jgi:hypothetical protein
MIVKSLINKAEMLIGRGDFSFSSVEDPPAANSQPTPYRRGSNKKFVNKPIKRLKIQITQKEKL